MLIGIPKLLSPDLLKLLMEMGHGDEIVLADSNFPAASHAERLIRCDGHEIPALLEAILQLMPLDQYVDKPAALMQVVPGDTVATPVWEVYGRIIGERAGLEAPFDMVERFDFYDRARKAYAIIATSETERYANIILKKGCVL
ncbi:L-fucose mutarotase [Paenibacillus taihuensis]|uniref:L-fucose mutarotase n=1 Tax=Paenibacillus taihuensis TaxID=1156355 RepID=A0A3D9RU53_9BACL|nr:RbsD/FucU domain-containing protein [Paenibacillus taihuensis]REE80225.1 L-fucose mutarotase [Paenibacillus taihuensis]